MEPIQNRCKRDHDEQMDTRHSRYADDDNWDNIEPKKNRSNKLLGFNATDVEQDRSKRKNSGDKDEKRKKSAGSGQAENLNEDDHEIKRESRSKISRKNTAERIEVRPNDVYDGKGLESIQQSTGDYNDLNSLRKNNLSPGHESSEGNGTNKVYNSPEDEIELAHDWESEYLDRKENAREKGHVQCEHERKISSRRRWDDMGLGRKTDDGSYMDRSDSRSEKSFEQGNPIDKPSDSRFDSGHTRGCIVDSTGEKGVSCGRVGKREDVERSRGLSEALDDAQKEVTEMIRDDKPNVMARSPALTDDMDWHRCSGKTPIVKSEKHKQRDAALHGSRDDVESMARSDEDVKHRMRDTNGRKVRYNKSPSSEESKSHPKDIEDHDRGQSESDTERNTAIKGKDSPKDSRDFRLSKTKDGGWVDKTMNLEGSKDHWGTQSKLATRVVNEFDNLKAWNSQIHEQVKVDGEKVQFLTGHKKDNKTRSEGGRFENSDSIEIKPDHNLDFASDVPFSAFLGGQADIESHQGGSGDTNDEEWGYPTDDDKVKVGYCDLQEKIDDVIDSQNDQIPGKNFLDSQGGNGRGQKGILNSSRICQGQNSGSIAQTSFGYSQGSNSFNKISQQGQKGGRAIRGGRGRIAGRDAPRGGIPVHMMGPPFGHLGLPSGTMQSMGPNMPPSVGPHLGPNVFIPPFAGPLAWPGGRGIDINMLVAPPNLPPIPPGPTGPRFASNLGAGLNQAMFFNQQVSGRVNANFSGSEFNAIGPVGREASNDKAPASWVQSRTNVPSGKAPSRGEQNDYSQNFVDTGMRPQNFIRELELTSIVEDYPKLRELIQRKDEIVINSSSPPMYYKTDLREFTLAPEFFGTKFDVILIDPPWEEYIHRAPGITDHMEYWTFEEIQNLKIEAIADTPSFIFLWVGDGVGLEQGRQCLKKWGFRRCEDICWVKTNKRNATPGLRHDSHTLFQHSKEHCLMGIKGTVRRSTDGHIIHANIDTDIIIAEEPPDGSTKKPDDMYRIVEHFSLGRRRLELFGGDHNIRPGWLTLGKGLTSSNFNTEAYIKNFTDKDGKVWHGGCGRNPPPDAPHLVATTPEIESLRPKSPPQKSQQQQQQQQLLAASSVVVPLIMGGSSSTRRTAMGGSPSASSAPILYQHQESAVSGLPIETAAVAAAYPWLLPPAPVAAAAAAAALGGIRELLPDGNHMGGSTGDGGFDRNNASFFGQLAGDHVELDPHRASAVNLMNINIM